MGALVLGASITFGAAPALAFVPPSNPANVFSCPGGNPVAGHPGSGGLMKAMEASDGLTAWHAVFTPSSPGADDGPVTLCP